MLSKNTAMHGFLRNFKVRSIAPVSLHEQHTEKSELLNTIYYDYASLNFSECEFLRMLARFWLCLADYQPPALFCVI